MGIELEKWGGMEDLGGDEEGKSMNRTYCIKKIFFIFNLK